MYDTLKWSEERKTLLIKYWLKIWIMDVHLWNSPRRSKMSIFSLFKLYTLYYTIIYLYTLYILWFELITLCYLSYNRIEWLGLKAIQPKSNYQLYHRNTKLYWMKSTIQPKWNIHKPSNTKFRVKWNILIIGHIIVKIERVLYQIHHCLNINSMIQILSKIKIKTIRIRMLIIFHWIRKVNRILNRQSKTWIVTFLKTHIPTICNEVSVRWISIHSVRVNTIFIMI